MLDKTLHTLITKPAILRLARVAGISRVSQDAYVEVRIRMVNFMQQILKQTILSAYRNSRKTLEVDDLDVAFRVLDKRLLIPGDAKIKPMPLYKGGYTRRRRGKSRGGKPSDAQIYFYRNHSDSITARKKPFFLLANYIAYDTLEDLSSLIPEIGEKFMRKDGSAAELRTSGAFKTIFQYAVESLTTNLLTASYAVTDEHNRQTINASHIQEYVGSSDAPISAVYQN